MTKKERIAKALEYADSYGGIDGGHHKMWVIDQMVRALTDCPMIDDHAYDYKQRLYSFKRQGESKTYKKFVQDRKDSGHDWDEGIAP